jgi:hypothetical protein
MGLVSKTVTVLFAVSLCGCEMKVKRAQTPAPPQPVPVKTEPPQEAASNEPLSIPQTQVRLPSPQPINPEAIATPPATLPAEAAGAHAAHRPGRSRPPAVPPLVAPVKPEPVETAETPPPAPAVEAPRPRIEPALPAEQRRQLNEEIASRQHKTEQMVAAITARKLSESEKRSVERIKSFLNLSHQALERGDTQQAGALADRASLLAQEMTRAQ